MLLWESFCESDHLQGLPETILSGLLQVLNLNELSCSMSLPLRTCCLKKFLYKMESFNRRENCYMAIVCLRLWGEVYFQHYRGFCQDAQMGAVMRSV